MKVYHARKPRLLRRIQKKTHLKSKVDDSFQVVVAAAVVVDGTLADGSTSIRKTKRNKVQSDHVTLLNHLKISTTYYCVVTATSR